MGRSFHLTSLMAEKVENDSENEYEEFADTRVYPIEIKDLVNLVVAEIPSKWNLIGVQLNIKDEKLKAIKMNISFGGDPKEFFVEVLSIWKKSECSPYNWATMLNALCSPSIDNDSLAKEIVEKLQHKKKTSQVQNYSTKVPSNKGIKKPMQNEGGLTAQYAVQVLKECEFRMFSNWKKVASTLGISLDDRKRLTENGRIYNDYDHVMEEALTLWIDKGNASWDILIDAVDREEKNTATRMRNLLEQKGLIYLVL